MCTLLGFHRYTACYVRFIACSNCSDYTFFIREVLLMGVFYSVKSLPEVSSWSRPYK